MEVEMVEISKLILLERNPRKITKDQFSKLCKSLESDPEFFYNRPALVHKEGEKLTVYAGNQRIKACKKLKWKKVPCFIEEGLSEEMIKRRIVHDNTHYGEWDWDILSSDFEIEDLLDAGFTPEMLHLDIEDLESEEEDKPKKEKAILCPSCGHEFTNK